jgi:hypothetical protein
MNFEDFESKVVGQNRTLWVALTISIIISSITLAFTVWNERYFVFSGGEIFKERPLAIHICKKGFESIMSGDPHGYFVTDGVLKLLEEEPFLIEIKEVIKLKSIETNRCHIVIKEKNLLRAFIITLISSDSFPFFYKLNQIDEVGTKGGQS